MLTYQHFTGSAEVTKVDFRQERRESTDLRADYFIRSEISVRLQSLSVKNFPHNEFVRNKFALFGYQVLRSSKAASVMYGGYSREGVLRIELASVTLRKFFFANVGYKNRSHNTKVILK